jgi:ElaB/YqjD/DUF883 family membrane-anchored ribosome-binding protein
MRGYNTPSASPVRCGAIEPYNPARPRAFPKEMDMTAAKFERSREALVKDFADVLTEADTLLKQAAKESGDRASDLRAQVEAKLRTAKLKLQDLQDDAVDRAKAAARATDEYVHDNPWQAIGIGAAIGFLFGLVLGRR